MTTFRAVPRLVLAALLGGSGAVGAEEGALSDLIAPASYPQAVEGGHLVWHDGARVLLDDGKGEKPFDRWLAEPDIAAMFALPYPAGAEASPLPRNDDPVAPARHRSSTSSAATNATARWRRTLQWSPGLPKRTKQQLPFNRLNGPANARAAVNRERNGMPARSTCSSFHRPALTTAGSSTAPTAFRHTRTPSHR